MTTPNVTEIRETSGPLEIRNFVPFYTIEHAKAGVPIFNKQFISGKAVIYASPQLQYRYKMVIHQGGATVKRWSEWIDVNFVLEESPPEAAPA